MTSRPVRPRARVSACFLAGAALLLAALAPARAETTSLRIGLQYGLVYLPVVVAQSQGLFDKRAREAGLDGLTVTLSRFSGSTAMNDALLSDSIELGTLGSTGALIAWDKTRGQQQIKCLTALSWVTYTLFTNKPGVHALKDFAFGDKVAVPAFNSPQAILLRAAAAKAQDQNAKDQNAKDQKAQDQGVRTDALLMFLPHPDATAALLAGQAITGYFATPPFTQVLAADRRVHVVMTSTGLIGDGEISAATLNAKQGFVEANPKVAQAVRAGMADAVALIRSDPKRAAAIYLASEQVQITPAQVEEILTDGSIVYDLAPKSMVALANAMQAQGFVKKVPATWQEFFFPGLKAEGGS